MIYMVYNVDNASVFLRCPAGGFALERRGFALVGRG